MRPGLKISVIVIVLFSSVIMTSAPAIKKTVKHEVIEKKVGDIALVYIPAGSFKMGRDVKGKDYSPVRTVKITKGFWIGKYEITQKQYSDLKGSNPCADSRYGEGDSLPLFNVSWYDAVEFCNALSVNHGLKPYYNISGIGTDDDNISTHDDIKREVTVNKGADGFRLPTEAEWEYACMGSKLSDFYWGNSQTWDGAGAYAWHMFNAGQKMLQQGAFLVGKVPQGEETRAEEAQHFRCL
jgi:formylglycine-generating enzyme required for sulfatase activity